MSFSQPVTGLQAAAAQLDVIGNNIANSSTVGFKEGSVAFKDVIAGSRIGLGVALAGVDENFAAGSVQLTNRPLDLAITNGSGFFQVASPVGSSIAFTRNGQFSVDKDGYVVGPTGLRLMGYGVTSTGALAGGTLAPLQFPTQSMTPNPTGNVQAQFNLDARDPVIATTFNANDSSTYSYANSVNVYDSLGNAHELSLYFVKTANNTWSVDGTVDGQALTSAPASVSISFDQNGAIDPTTASFTLSGNYGNGSAPASFAIDLANSTQFGNTSA
ncbi:MAG TPA: flagellar hook-basal body complex protein, partial [Ramlibacter sp.]|nr:flagellar hook-basal body complex protein [Ramlibacter sp.]